MTKVLTEAALPRQNCIVIYTDGACQPNPGPGAYAAILCRYINGALMNRMPRSGGATSTTNIRMEMSAVVAALKPIRRDEPLPIFIFTDSEMIVKGMTDWLPGWIAKGWRNNKGKRVENVDLWQEIARLCEGLDVTFRWERGRSGDPMKQEAHQLAEKTCAIWIQKADDESFCTAA